MSCYNCGLTGHKKSECKLKPVGGSFKSKIRCYGCDQMVTNLKDHKSSCIGSLINASNIPGNIIDEVAKSLAKLPSSTIEATITTSTTNSSGSTTQSVVSGNFNISNEPVVHHSKIRCFACNEMVFELREHKKICLKSSSSFPNTTTTTTTTTTSSTSTINNISSIIPTIPPPKKERRQDVYFLIDTSGSMAGRRLRDAKDTARSLSQQMKPLDRLSIISFDSSAHSQLSIKTVEEIKRKDMLHLALKKLEAKGTTAIYDAIILAVSEIKDKTQKALLLVLTDGEDNASKHTYQEAFDNVSQFKDLSLNIFNINGRSAPNIQLQNLCQVSSNGAYQSVSENDIKKTIEITFKVKYEI